MGSIQDLLQEVPLAAVLRERVALADQKYETAMREVAQLKERVADLERENAELRAQIPADDEDDAASLQPDTARVLVHLFKANLPEARDVGNMAMTLGMERGVLQYHLDRLYDAGLAETAGANYLHGHVYWALTPEGRRYAVECKLI
jgi:DNA-binding transcriptional ArsR family regulator